MRNVPKSENTHSASREQTAYQLIDSVAESFNEFE